MASTTAATADTYGTMRNPLTPKADARAAAMGRPAAGRSGSSDGAYPLLPSVRLSARAECTLLVVSFAVMMVSNVISGATDVFNDTNNSKLSNANPTWLTPDGSTFSIWGFIYIGELLGVVYVCRAGDDESGHMQLARRWLIAAFTLNAIWLPVFAFRRWWLSFAVIATYLYSLLQSTRALGVDYGRGSVNGASVWTKLALYTGLSLNMGWVVVATLLNLTVVARNSGIITTVVTEGVSVSTAGANAAGTAATIGGNEDWAVLCVVVASLLALYRCAKFADMPYAFVTAWALGGIYRMQHVANDERFPASARSDDLQQWAVVMIVVVACGGVAALALAVQRTRTAGANSSAVAGAAGAKAGHGEGVDKDSHMAESAA